VPLAVKIISKERVNSMEALKRVDSEIMAQKTLVRHRGVLRVHDVVNAKRGLYVVMDKVRRREGGGGGGGIKRRKWLCRWPYHSQ